ncbi:MAG TPA: SRPBCC family protein [Candidatus Acidoferrales bacterium]|nr:SRPBCC family protein [Candidatus Acidoferrales bacterium]
MAAMEQQEFTTEVDASVPQCFATITDFDAYPDWFSTVEKTRVLERYLNGLAKRVELRVDMKLKSIRYVLEYEYHKPTNLTWKQVDGDLEAIEGAYVFEKLGPKRTRVTCRQAVAMGFWVPGPFRKIIERQALKQSVLEFKAAAESAAKKAASRRQKAKGKGMHHDD